MHAVKVTWSGQTFALAKGNDSQGKKSRIRRSKEERRAMVESFINKYRSSNNGSFPSLNLTHKEVGGSFYTVREIVRDIIQENRVLGPAAGFSEEHSLDYSSEQYELDSLSSGIHISLSLSSGIGSTEHGKKENSAILDEFQEEPVSVPRGNSKVSYYEMVESKEVEKTNSHSNENHIPQFIHKDATEEQQNLYGSERMNGSLNDEESKEAAKESLKLRKHITQENKASFESPSGEKLDDEIGKQNNDADGLPGPSVDDGVIAETVVSNTILEDMEMSGAPIHQPSMVSLNFSETHALSGVQALETNLSAEEVLLDSDLISSSIVTSDAVDKRIEVETFVSGPSSDSSNSHLKGIDLEGSRTYDGKLNLQTDDQVTKDEIPPMSNEHQIKEVNSSASVHSDDGDSSSPVTDQISSHGHGSLENASNKPREAGEINPVWSFVKSVITAFVKFWVE